MNEEQIINLVLGLDRITGFTLGRARFEKRAVSQDMELWLANVSFAPVGSYVIHLFNLFDELQCFPHYHAFMHSVLVLLKITDVGQPLASSLCRHLLRMGSSAFWPV